MNRIKIGGRLLAIAVVMLAMSGVANAQINSNIATVTVNFSQSESLSVLASPATLTFNAAGVANAPLSVTVNWNLAQSRSHIEPYLYFASSNALTDGTGDNIPASSFGADCGAGTATFANGGTVPFGPADWGVDIGTIPVTAGNYTGTHTSSCQLSFSGAAALPAGSYTGTLNVEAQAS
jgi:hypothetical protein